MSEPWPFDLEAGERIDLLVGPNELKTNHVIVADTETYRELHSGPPLGANTLVDLELPEYFTHPYSISRWEWFNAQTEGLVAVGLQYEIPAADLYRDITYQKPMQPHGTVGYHSNLHNLYQEAQPSIMSRSPPELWDGDWHKKAHDVFRNGWDYKLIQTWERTVTWAYTYHVSFAVGKYGPQDFAFTEIDTVYTPNAFPKSWSWSITSTQCPAHTYTASVTVVHQVSDNTIRYTAQLTGPNGTQNLTNVLGGNLTASTAPCGFFKWSSATLNVGPTGWSQFTPVVLSIGPITHEKRLERGSA